MPLVDRFYDWLSQGPTPDCDRIFAAALVHAEPAWSERIIRALLGRGHEASWAALIGQYERLTPRVRDQLRERSDSVQAGIVLTLGSSSPEARANALRALDEQPAPRMAYLLPDALRDPEPRVRTLAACVWRKMVDSFLDHPPPAADADAASCRAWAVERRQILLALEEALRTFDLHKRVEVLETALWFARELGETLWKTLTSRHSRAGLLAGQYLSSWSHPRLAHFLVCALSQPTWRGTAGRVLRTWKSAPELSALLRESDLLDDPRIREQLDAVQYPQWFTKCDDGLTGVSPDLRPSAPRWVCHAGYRERDRAALLSRWLNAPDRRLRDAVVYALAEVDTAGARAVLRQVADSSSPLAAFARWCVAGFDTDRLRSAIRAAARRQRRVNHEPPPDPARQQDGLRLRASNSARSLEQRTRRALCVAPRQGALPHSGSPSVGKNVDQGGREFRMALKRLSGGGVHPADTDLIGRARSLLQDVYVEEFEPADIAVLQGDD